MNTSGQITGISVGSGGNCSDPTHVTCTVTGAPQTYPWGPGLDASGDCANGGAGNRLMFSGSQLVGIATTTPIASLTGTLFSQGLNSGGMILENVNMFASPGLIQDGLWIEGIVNPLIGHLHCQGMNTSSTTPGFCDTLGPGMSCSVADF